MNKKILSATLMLVIIISASLGFFGIREKASRASVLLQENVSYPAAGAVNVNRAINGETGHSSGQRDGNKETEENILYLLSSVNTVSSNANGALLSGLVFMACFYLVSAGRKKKSVSKLSSLKYYIRWHFQFKTPTQKTILNRAQEYDINPLGDILREKNPRFAYDQNAGFFYRR